MAEIGSIPKEDAAEIRQARQVFRSGNRSKSKSGPNHDVIAFLENVAELRRAGRRWMHQGMTSSDVLDTTLAVQMTEASRTFCWRILRELREGRSRTGASNTR